MRWQANSPKIPQKKQEKKSKPYFPRKKMNQALSFQDMKSFLKELGGDGIDVVLNSLSHDDYIGRSLALLKPGGRFMEIGKRGARACFFWSGGGYSNSLRGLASFYPGWPIWNKMRIISEKKVLRTWCRLTQPLNFNHKPQPVGTEQSWACVTCPKRVHRI